MSTQNKVFSSSRDFIQTAPKDAASNPATIRAKDVLVVDLIEAPVISVGPGTTVREVAWLLTKKKISGVPVVDNGEVVGIVTEGDLIRRHELGRTAGVAEHSEDMNADYSKAYGIYARDIMTRNVITVAEDTPLPNIIEIMLSENIRRVLVARQGKLLGVISRSDIVRVLAARPENAGHPMSDDDDILRFKIIEVLMEIPGINPWHMTVTVSKGVVEVCGRVDDEAVRESSRVAIETLPYVRGVIDKRSSVLVA